MMPDDVRALYLNAAANTEIQVVYDEVRGRTAQQPGKQPCDFHVRSRELPHGPWRLESSALRQQTAEYDARRCALRPGPWTQPTAW
jgi:hypothetical protein